MLMCYDNIYTKSALFLLSLAVVVVTMGFGGGGGGGGGPAEKWYPDEGNFYYNGYRFVDMDLTWDNPGDFYTTFSSSVAVEIDFATFRYSWEPKLPYDGCSSMTNLPQSYDDCTTAGVSDGDTQISFGFGTFNGELLNDFQYNTSIFLQKSPTWQDWVFRKVGWNVTAQQIEKEPSCFNPWCLLNKLGEHQDLVGGGTSDLALRERRWESWDR